MLVVFRSTATESITMFEEVAIGLLKLMGATGRIPGALGPEDVGPALRRLESATEQIRAGTRAGSIGLAHDKGTPDDDECEPPVDLVTRAAPLIAVLKRAAAAHAELMWEAKEK